MSYNKKISRTKYLFKVFKKKLINYSYLSKWHKKIANIKSNLII